MGRISKTKIDQIVELRRKGFLQREVAEKTHTNVKTVAKYDALGGEVSKPQAKRRGTPAPPSLDERVSRLEDWYWVGSIEMPMWVLLTALSAALQVMGGRRPISIEGFDPTEPNDKHCPACWHEYLEKQEPTDDDADLPTLNESGICPRCSRQFFPPLNPWQRRPQISNK